MTAFSQENKIGQSVRIYPNGEMSTFQGEVGYYPGKLVKYVVDTIFDEEYWLATFFCPGVELQYPVFNFDVQEFGTPYFKMERDFEVTCENIAGATDSLYIDYSHIYNTPEIPDSLSELTDDLGITGLPSQTGNAGKVLTTDGTNPSWTTVSSSLTAQTTLDFPNTTAGNSSELTITVTGATAGSCVAIGIPNASVPAGGCFFGWVSETDTVTIRYCNTDLLVSRNPDSGTFKIIVIQ